MTAIPDGVPTLDALSSEWIDAADLAHLHSLRNQWGQAHVNADLTSLSWLAIPPFAGGYRTGVLRVDGRVPAADAFRWAPWGVRRRARAADGVAIETDTRLGFEEASVLWRVSVANTTREQRTVEVELELLAPVAHSEVDWGWLHGTPWNDGHRHDFYTTERLRAEATADAPRHVQLVSDDLRHVRLGRPRVPGIQRDEDDAPMLLESALPAHVTPDSPSLHRAPAARAEIGRIVVRSAGGDDLALEGPWLLRAPGDEERLSAVSLGDGGELSFSMRLTEACDGVLLTHGNHPDSLQFAIEDGCLSVHVGGETLRTGRRLAPGVLHEVSARVGSDGAVVVLDGVEDARSAHWWHGQRWSAHEQGEAVTVVDAASPARSAFAFSRRPDALAIDGQRGLARWRLVLEPGEQADLGAVLMLGTDAAEAKRRATAAARRFELRFAAVAEDWRRLWANAFTPGNIDHSGYLPVFESEDEGLALGYYYAVLLALYMRNTGVSGLSPVFLTGGPRLGATTTFYWDQSEWVRIGAMLEPQGLRAWILAALSQDYDASHSFDTRSLSPVGNHYASNDHALFTIVEHYVGVTGDHAILEESAAGRSVLDHLRTMAYRHRTRHARFGEGVLVDLGRDAWELLECVPNYRDAVVSFNAGYAGMLRSFAALLEQRDEVAEAADARADAERLTAAVLGQYAGAGRWRIAHPEGDETIGHCLDFELVAAHLADALTDHQREEMVAFVEHSLLDGDWMRALDPADPIAPFSDRPDHGAAGAFAGWPGSTAYGLARLGRADLAAALLSRVHRSRSGALWGQAVEAIGDGRFRVAERGVSNRESSAAVAIAEAIVGGLFGIAADFEHGGTGRLTSAYGTVRNVRAVGFDLPRPPRDDAHSRVVTTSSTST